MVWPFPSSSISGEPGHKFPTKLEKIPLSKKSPRNPWGAGAAWGRGGETKAASEKEAFSYIELEEWAREPPPTRLLSLSHTSWVCVAFAGKLILNSQPIIHYNWKYGDASEMMLILESECQLGLPISEIHTSLSALKLPFDWNFYKLNPKSNITELPNVTELLIKGMYHFPLNRNIKVHFQLEVTETLFGNSASLLVTPQARVKEAGK